MSLYPSLEDMKVDQMMKAQHNAIVQQHHQPPQSNVGPSAPFPTIGRSTPVPADKLDTLYPDLNDYMGLSLSSAELAMISQPTPNAVAIPQPNQVVVSGDTTMVAPLSGSSLGFHRAKVSHGIREIVLCKDSDGRVGMRVQSINKGIFVVFVHANSPAAIVGLRFGDQILQINGDSVAGFSRDKVHEIVKKMPVNGIKLIVRDRPFERTITLHKDSTGHVGFAYKNGKITDLIKESSAARNGLLIEHNILEVNGQNVVGMNDKGIRGILDAGGDVITLTIMPTVLYDHMIKHMATSLVKKFMDHSIPDL